MSSLEIIAGRRLVATVRFSAALAAMYSYVARSAAVPTRVVVWRLVIRARPGVALRQARADRYEHAKWVSAQEQMIARNRGTASHSMPADEGRAAS